MTTTAHEDQFTDAPDPVRQPYSIDEGDMILVPRGLLGAACSSIDKQRPAPKVLEALRYYTMNAPQAPAVPDDIHELAYELGGTDSGEYHLNPEDLDRIIAAAKSAPSVPEDWRNIVTEMLGWLDDPAMTMSQGKVIAEKARALLQSAGGAK